MTKLRVGDVVRPLSDGPSLEVKDTSCEMLGCKHPLSAWDDTRHDTVNGFGPAIVTAFSNVPGNVYVRRPFEHRMIYVFRIEDLEVVYTAKESADVALRRPASLLASWKG